MITLRQLSPQRFQFSSADDAASFRQPLSASAFAAALLPRPPPPPLRRH
jgi:hypothetical protein